MSEPILDPAFWRERLAQARQSGQLHHGVFRCPLPTWQAIEAKHREILARTIGPSDSILDAGCGWGRLLDLLPKEWQGAYLGIDLSPDFINLAWRMHGDQPRLFQVADLRDLSEIQARYGWAILISIRPMVRRNLGEEVWAKMEAELRRVARKILYLEYDPADEGSIE